MLYSWCAVCQIQRGHVTRVGGGGNVIVYTYKAVCVLVGGRLKKPEIKGQVNWQCSRVLGQLAIYNSLEKCH